MTSAKRTLTTAQLQEHLQEQLEFLESSCDAFDQGRLGEAKRIAVVLRVLLHDTSHSHSLLGQLGSLNGSLISTALPHEPKNLSTHGGLVSIAMKGASTEYIPIMDGFFKDWLPYQKWWEQPVFVDDQREVLSRKDLVLTAANQDGGAHVDPALNEKYARLRDANSLGWMYSSGDQDGQPIPGAEKAAIRQIGHEVLLTLVPGYSKTVDRSADMFIAGGMITEGDRPPPIPRPRAIERNEPCPCGTGRKFKKCHGDPTLRQRGESA